MSMLKANPNKAMETMMEKVNKLAINALNAEIDQAFSDIFESEVHHNQLPEYLFVNMFLPYFTGKVADNAHLNMTTKWIAVAGSAMNPVDVIDGTGKVLFTVPSLMSSDFLRTKENIRSKSFNDIFNDAKKQSTRIPTLGEKIIGTEGVKKMQDLSKNLRQQDDKESQWDYIFHRYHIETPKTKTGIPITSKKKDLSDELEFD
ncbi:MAG TPA: hypothetical protein VN843_00580 [Anaerolineales bacterium]|nr:hypothetical protein [Anaerolineales bacterium]